MIREAAIALVMVATPGAYAQVQSITVERGPCLGACPVYRFKVAAAFTGRTSTRTSAPRECCAPLLPHNDLDDAVFVWLYSFADRVSTTG